MPTMKIRGSTQIMPDTITDAEIFSSAAIALSKLEPVAYRHIEAAPSAVWTITHNLSFYPNVTVVDSTGRQVEGDVEYLSAATVRVTFSAGFAGECYLT